MAPWALMRRHADAAASHPSRQVGQPLALQAARAELDPYQAQEREYEELLCLSNKGGQKCTEVRTDGWRESPRDAAY